MSLPTSALRLRRNLTHAPSPAAAAVVERVRVDVEARCGAEFAERWAARVAANPVLLWIYASPGLDPRGEAS